MRCADRVARSFSIKHGGERIHSNLQRSQRSAFRVSLQLEGSWLCSMISKSGSVTSSFDSTRSDACAEADGGCKHGHVGVVCQKLFHPKLLHFVFVCVSAAVLVQGAYSWVRFRLGCLAFWAGSCNEDEQHAGSESHQALQCREVCCRLPHFHLCSVVVSPSFFSTCLYLPHAVVVVALSFPGHNWQIAV